MSYDIISHKLVKTRKPHKCWGCTKEFPAGSMLWNCVSKEDEIISTYWCESCQELVEQDADSVDGYYFGELADYAEDIQSARESVVRPSREVA